MAGGTFCNPPERNYSPIEGEATAISRDSGTQNSTPWDAVGGRGTKQEAARIKEKLMPWRFNMVYKWQNS